VPHSRRKQGVVLAARGKQTDCFAPQPHAFTAHLAGLLTDDVSKGSESPQDSPDLSPVFVCTMRVIPWFCGSPDLCSRTFISLPIRGPRRVDASASRCNRCRTGRKNCLLLCPTVTERGQVAPNLRAGLCRFPRCLLLEMPSVRVQVCANCFSGSPENVRRAIMMHSQDCCPSHTATIHRDSRQQ